MSITIRCVVVALIAALAAAAARPAAADPLNPNAVILGANCTGLGEVTLTWLIRPTDAVRGSSAMQVVGSNEVVVIFTGGSETIGMHDETSCTFTSFDGVPITPVTFFVLIAPRSPA